MQVADSVCFLFKKTSISPYIHLLIVRVHTYMYMYMYCYSVLRHPGNFF